MSRGKILWFDQIKVSSIYMSTENDVDQKSFLMNYQILVTPNLCICIIKKAILNISGAISRLS